MSAVETSQAPPALVTWHRVVAERNPVLLGQLLAEDATFHSPVVHTPQAGRDLVSLYLTGAMHVLGNATFHYVREVVGDSDAVLEFVAEVDGLTVNGVDMITWNEEGQITDFKVMIRPLKAVNLLHAKMGELLLAMQAEPQNG